MNYSAIDIAEYVITESTKQNKPVSNLKLQILLYCLWRDYHKATGNALFDDYFCTRQFGPFVPSVYHEYSCYAGTPITREYETEIKREDKDTLDGILEDLLNEPIGELARNVCLPGKAWDSVYKAGEGDGRIIPFNLIMQKDL